MTSKQQFDAAVDAKKASGMSHTRAVSASVKENPDLHAAMIKEANAGRPVGLAASRFRD